MFIIKKLCYIADRFQFSGNLNESDSYLVLGINFCNEVHRQMKCVSKYDF